MPFFIVGDFEAIVSKYIDEVEERMENDEDFEYKTKQ